MELIFKMTLSIPKHASCSIHVDASEENVAKKGSSNKAIKSLIFVCGIQENLQYSG
jgi:hypothetical protein